MAEKLTMLVADEVEVNRVSLKEMSQSEYEIVEAKSIAEAMEVLGRQHIDLVVLDLFLSETDGCEVLRRMKSDSRLREIPVVVQTASDEAMEARMLDLGADDFIYSPADPAVIRSRVRNVMENSISGRRMLQNRLAEQTRVNRIQGNFLNGIVAEMRRPIRSLFATTGQLSSWKEEKAQETLREVRKQTGYLEALTEDLSEMGRLCGGEKKKFTAAFWLNEMIAAIAGEFYERCRRRGIQLSFKVSRWIHTAFSADLTPLRVIWKSLLAHFYLNTADDGKIRTTYQERVDGDGQAVLEIEICCAGERAFSSVPGGKKSDGILLAESLTELMGGTMEAISADGGAEQGYHVMLPAGRLKEKKKIRSIRELNAIVISGDACTGSYLSAGLARLGARCRVLDDPGLALNVLRENGDDGFHVCFLDQNLSREERIELVRQIRAQSAGNPMAIVGITDPGAGREEDPGACGVDDLLERPLLQEKIYRLVVRLCRDEAGGKTDTDGCFAGKRVLLIGEDTGCAALYRDYFKDAGMECHLAESGEAALDQFRGQRGAFDVVVTDLFSGTSGGEVVAREIRRLEGDSGKKMPIIAVLNRGCPEELTRISEAGMNTFLPRSADRETIFQTMEKYIQCVDA